MATKTNKRKNPKPKTFVQRVADWALLNADCAAADPAFDTELTEIGKAAWRLYCIHVPALANVVISAVNLINHIEDLTCPRKNPRSVVNYKRICRNIRVYDLADAVLDALGVPRDGAAAYDDTGYSREGDITLAHCCHGLGSDYIDCVLGLILLVHTALRLEYAGEITPKANDRNRLLAALDVHLAGKGIT